MYVFDIRIGDFRRVFCVDSIDVRIISMFCGVSIIGTLVLAQEIGVEDFLGSVNNILLNVRLLCPVFNEEKLSSLRYSSISSVRGAKCLSEKKIYFKMYTFCL